ncbi:MAG TPA: signal peptidase I [Solirubrobacteraceae bacterium]|nr:signal peptidase I [Solirubrobacteraceae bacterium]
MWLYAVLGIAVTVVVVAIALQLDRTPAQTLRVMSGSMRPTLAIGQLVHVDAAAYASSEPRIGDLVAFHAPVGATGTDPICGVPQPAGEACPQPTPAESAQIFIKRIVAAPGDMVSVVGGSVVRNGVIEREPFTATCTGSGCNFPVPIHVPAGEWFVMGDDRGASDDSRYWGPVPAAWIVGKVRS